MDAAGAAGAPAEVVVLPVLERLSASRFVSRLAGLGSGAAAQEDRAVPTLLDARVTLRVWVVVDGTIVRRREGYLAAATPLDARDRLLPSLASSAIIEVGHALCDGSIRAEVCR